MVLGLTIFWLFVISIVGVVLFFSLVGVIIGSSLMISSWYTERNTIGDIKKIESFENEFFKTETFSDLIEKIEEYGNTLSRGYSYGLILFFVSLAIVIPMGIIAIRTRNIYEFFSGQVLRLRLTSTSITIIFTIMTAISLIFISSISFVEISKNQIITNTLEFLINSDNQSKIIGIFEKELISNYVLIFINVLNASYFALAGFFFLAGRIVQYYNNERPNIISEIFIITGLFAIIFWIIAFLIVTGIEPAPSLYHPETIQSPFK